MKTKRLLFCVLFLFCVSICKPVHAQVNTTDSLALVDYYNSTGGPNWKSHTNWLTTQPVSTWYGITVRNNRVVSLTASYNRLSGSLPTSIGNLDSLQTLALTNNFTSLTGAIPSSIGNLHRLSLLDLNTNGFTGSIPSSIGNIDSLQTLNLSYNSLSGAIPLSMRMLKKLTVFDASFNRAGIGHISGNGISGAIPDSLGYCTSLATLNLSVNSLTGSLPSSFQKLAKLTRLEVYDNQLSGPLTNVFASQSVLNYLNLSGNMLSGTIPSFFSQLTKLATLLLANNQLSGTIPDDLSNAASLVSLDLSSNQLSGNIPAKLNSLPVLISLNLSSNKLTGQLPFLLHNYSLANPNLNVSNNQLTNSRNPQWNGTGAPGVFNMAGNRFTFNGLEYLNEKYFTVNDAPQALLTIRHQNGTLTVYAGGTLRKNTYYWYRVGNPTAVVISGNASYQPSATGNYYVNVKNKTVTDLTLMSDTVAYTAPGIISSTPTVSVYPNPVRGMISINGLDDKATMNITVADMSGYVWLKLVSHKQTHVQMDGSRLKAGNYLVTISDGTDIKTIQFVKE